jgi:hypothetical protein
MCVADAEHVAKPAVEASWQLVAVAALLELLHCCIQRWPAAGSAMVVVGGRRCVLWVVLQLLLLCLRLLQLLLQMDSRSTTYMTISYTAR